MMTTTNHRPEKSAIGSNIQVKEGLVLSVLTGRTEWDAVTGACCFSQERCCCEQPISDRYLTEVLMRVTVGI